MGITVQVEDSNGNNNQISNHHQAKLLEKMFAQNEQFKLAKKFFHTYQ
jgi:hypothetical protein